MALGRNDNRRSRWISEAKLCTRKVAAESGQRRLPDFNATSSQGSAGDESTPKASVTCGPFLLFLLRLLSLSLSLSPPPRSFTSFLFLPRRKLFTRRILVAQNEPEGYLLSIDRFWKQAKSFRPSRGLTSFFISLSSVSLCLFPFSRTFLAPFSFPLRTSRHYRHPFFLLSSFRLCRLPLSPRALSPTDVFFLSFSLSLCPLRACNFLLRVFPISFFRP